MTIEDFRIRSNEQLTQSVWRMILEGNTEPIKKSGQFVNIQIDGLYLRRPISVCDYDSESITLVYKVVGEGTERLTQYTAGDSLNLMTGLGNGFSTDVASEKPLLIGGGVGIPPLFSLAKRLIAEGKNPTVLLCFNTKSEVFLFDEFKQLTDRVFVSTIDGSEGVKGFFSDIIREKSIDYDYYYTCGPLPMLRAIHETLTSQGQLSFEERMGCGFGGCMGCTHRTKSGYKKICQDTILTSDDVIF